MIDYSLAAELDPDVLARRYGPYISGLASVPRRGLPFLLLKLLVLKIGPGLSKANFFPDPITAPLNHTNIRLDSCSTENDYI